MGSLYWLHVDLGKGRERHSVCLSLTFCEEVWLELVCRLEEDSLYHSSGLSL